MNDCELLEAAAKAAGHGVYFDHRSGLSYMEDKFTGLLWDPLNNDGDALRLAVKLNLLLMPYPDDKAVRVTRLDQPDTIVAWGTPADPYAASRRAIVRAAAAMSDPTEER